MQLAIAFRSTKLLQAKSGDEFRCKINDFYTPWVKTGKEQYYYTLVPYVSQAGTFSEIQIRDPSGGNNGFGMIRINGDTPARYQL